MPVPASLASLSTTAGSNPPAGTENPFPDLDDHIRAGYAFDAQNRDAIAAKLNASAVSAFGLTLIDDADAATARATLGAVGTSGDQTVAGVKTFSSSPIAPTPTTGDNTTKVATTAFVKTTADASAASAVSDRGRVYQPAAQATTSGTGVDFSSIPSWARRITVSFSALSTNGSAIPLVRIGTSAGLVMSGYSGASAGCVSGASPLIANLGLGFGVGADNSSSSVKFGAIVLTHEGGNKWIASGTGGQSDTARMWWVGGDVSLPGVLDRISLTTTNGTDQFDGGSVSILVEG